MKYIGRIFSLPIGPTVLRLLFRNRTLSDARACLGVMILHALFSSVGYAQQASPELLRSASAILALSPDHIIEGEPVLLRGVITRSTDYGFFLQDKTAGVWVFRDHPFGIVAHDLVELTGVVHQGRFSPGVIPTSIRKVGQAPLPQARATSVEELSNGDLDAQFVSLRGIVRSVGLRKGASQSQRLWLKLATRGGSIYASLPESDSVAASSLTGSLIEVHAVAACTKNQNRQIIAPTLMVPGMECITVLQPAQQSLKPPSVISIRRLMQYRTGTNYTQPVKVIGTVTYNKPGESLILEEGGRALYVATLQNSSIKPGDRIEATGYPAPANTGPILQDAVVRTVGGGVTMRPAKVTASDLSAGTFNNSLVSVEGRFLRRVEEPYRVVLLIQAGSALLLAQLSENDHSRPLQGLKEGSIVRVSGISMLDTEGTWNVDGPSASVIRYEILLRSLDDVQVIHLPSWWTKQHVIYLASVLGLLVLVFAGRDIYSRVAQWKLQAVLNERERMAFEIHDTLAQSLAGIGFQLQAIRRGVPAEHTDLLHQVDVARALVQHSHKEARRHSEQSIVEAGGEIDLIGALYDSVSGMVVGSSVEVHTATSGKLHAIPPNIRNALLRIGQEALANSVRHANPSHLHISMVFEEDNIRLILRDDGCGFTRSGDLLGFGLRAMRKRAASISAILEIDSEPGTGTRVEVIAPLPPSPDLLERIQQYWKYFRERVLHVRVG